MSAHDWRRATAAPFGGRNFVAYQGSPGRTRLPVHHAPHAPHSADASRASYGPDASLNGTAPLPRLQRSLDGSLEVENSRLRGAVDELQSALELQRTGYEQRVRDAMDVGNQSSAAVAAAQDAADASAQEVSSAHHAALQLRRQVAVLEAELQAERQRHGDAVATDREQQARAAVAAQTEAGRLSQEIVGLSEENARLRAVVAEQRGDLAKAADNAAAQSTALQDLTREVTRLDPYQLVKQHRQSEAAQQLQGELIEKIEAGARDVAMARAERDSAREELQRLHAALEDQGREARDQRIALREAHDAEQRSWRQDTDALRSQLRAAEQRASGAEAAAAAGKDSDAELRFVLQTSRGKAERAAQQVQQLADSLEALRVEHQALLDRCGDLEAEARRARAKLADATAATKRAEARATQADAKAAAAVDAQVSADAAAAAERERAQVLSRRGEALKEDLDRAGAAAAAPAEPTLSGIGRRLSHEEEEEVERRVEERTEEAEAQAAEAQLRAEGEKAARLAAEAAAVAAPQQAVPVRLRVVRCAGLLDRDGGKIASGASDPYVRVVDPFGAEVLRTAVVDNTVDPVFPPDSSTAAVTVAPDTEGSVVLEVWDWNPLGDSYLGGHAVPVADLFEYGPCTRELRLQPREQEPDDLIFDSVGHLGALYLEVAGVPAVETSPVRARPEPDAVQHDVTLRVVKCAGLMDRDGGLSGRSDPYVTVTGARGDVVLTTPVVDNTLHPAFDRDAATAALRLSKATPGAVRVDAWDHNTVGRDKYLGGATVSVEDLFAFGPATRTLPLRPRPKESDPEVFARAGELGTVTVEVGGVPPSAAPPRPVPRTRTGGETTVVAHTVPVTIAVAACHDLLNRDGGGAFGDSDPFVVVRDPRGTEVLRTPTIDNSSDPTWSRSEAGATVQLSKATPGALRVDVWNWNHVRNDYLGGCDLPVAELFDRGNGPWPLRLRPRPKESDRFVVDNAHRLGSATVFISHVPVLQEAPAPSAPPAAPPAVSSPLRNGTTVSFVGEADDDEPSGGDVAPGAGTQRPSIASSVDDGQLGSDPFAPQPLSTSMRATGAPVDLRRRRVSSSLVGFGDDDEQFVDPADLAAAAESLRLQRPPPGEEDEGQGDGGTGEARPAVESTASLDPSIAEQSPTPPAAAPTAVGPTSVQATVSVVGCTGLMDRDGGFSGVSDPFVKLLSAAGEVMHTSSVIDNELNPTWAPPDASADLVVVRPAAAAEAWLDAPAAVIEVWDHNTVASNTFLGRAEVSNGEVLALATAGATNEFSMPLLQRRDEMDGDVVAAARSGLGLGSIKVGLTARSAADADGNAL